MRKRNGFSLVQLMLTVTIFGILLTLALPSFSSSMRMRKLNGSVELLRADLNFARSEAIKRNSNVILCKSSNFIGCSGSWSDGWIIFADRNNNHAMDSGDTLIRSTAGPEEYTLTWLAFPIQAGNTYLNFDPTGFSIHNGSFYNGTFKFCPNDNNVAFAKKLVISRFARIRDGNSGESLSCP